MEKKIWYPKPEDVVEYNKKIIRIHKETKAEKPEVLSFQKIEKSINKAKRKEGDIEDKAAVLMRELNTAHSFGSANKRTAFFTANKMLWCNKNYGLAINRMKQSAFAKKIRGRKVTDKEIAKFLGKCKT